MGVVSSLLPHSGSYATAPAPYPGLQPQLRADLLIASAFGSFWSIVLTGESYNQVLTAPTRSLNFAAVLQVKSQAKCISSRAAALYQPVPSKPAKTTGVSAQPYTRRDLHLYF